MRRLTGMRTALALLLSLWGAAPAHAQDAATVTMTGVRSWSAPINTRIVVDLDAPVAPVAPDSGETRELVVALPYPGLVSGPDVRRVLAVRDSAIDSVWVVFDPAGARLRVTMAPGTTLRGRVTVEGTDTPVPQAIVTVEAGTVFDDAVLRGLPGRERGLSAQVGAAGKVLRPDGEQDPLRRLPRRRDRLLEGRLVLDHPDGQVPGRAHRRHLCHLRRVAQGMVGAAGMRHPTGRSR